MIHGQRGCPHTFNRCPQAELPTGGLEDTEPSAPAADLRRMAERHSFWPPGLRAVAARRSKALSSSAPPCQISPHAPTRPGSACRNDAGMMGGCGEHASGTARTLRVATTYLVRGVARGGCERVEERGARVRAHGKVGLYFITGIKETQNGTRAARTRARITSTLTQQIKRCGQPRRVGFLRSKEGRQRICARLMGALDVSAGERTTRAFQTLHHKRRTRHGRSPT